MVTSDIRAWIKANPTKTMTIPTPMRRREYRLIQAWQARNYDAAPWKQGTPNGDQFCVEEKYTAHGKTRYINHWGTP